MTTERERLINWAKQLADPNWCLSVPKEAKDVISQLVAALEPRQVTTTADMEALPEGSLILSHSEYPRYTGTVWRVSSGRVVEKVGREAEGVTPFGYFKDPLPATVLYSPVVAQ